MWVLKFDSELGRYSWKKITPLFYYTIVSKTTNIAYKIGFEFCRTQYCPEGSYFGYCNRTGVEITGFTGIVGGGETVEVAKHTAYRNIQMYADIVEDVLIKRVSSKCLENKPVEFNFIKYRLCNLI